MTAIWRSDTPEDPFDAWVRNHPDLHSIRDCIAVTDTDKWVHRYGFRRTRWGVDRDVQYLMMVERKTHCRDLDRSQRDTLHIINQLLRTVPWSEQRLLGRLVSGHAQNSRVVYSAMNGRRVQIICYGAHKLRLSGGTPDDSDWMTWDDKAINTRQLVSLFRFEISPDTLRPLEHRTHKRQVSDEPLWPDALPDLREA